MSLCCSAQFVVLLLSLVVLVGATVDLIYSCNPSGTITVENPNATRYTGAFAQTQDGTQNCTTFKILGDTFIVSGCSISRNITFWLFEDTIGGNTLPTIITDDISFYVIRCQQIPATGIYRMVTDESWVTNYISTSLEPSVTPRIMLNTQLQDIESGVQKTTAIIGEPLLWEMTGPEGYFILPLNCTVLSGAGDESIVLIIDGCSEDTYLVTDFIPDATRPHVLQAELYAFRFASSEQIIIECDMLGCANTSTACDYTCFGSSDRRRGRRNIFDDHVNDLLERQSAQGTVQQGSNTRESKMRSGDFVGQVNTRLRVFRDDGFLFDNGAPKLVNWTGLLISYFIIFSVVKIQPTML